MVVEKNSSQTNPQEITPLYLPDTGFLRLKEVLRFFPLSRAAWYGGMADGRFPRPVNLGPRARGYKASDIRRLIKEFEGAENVR